MPLKFFCFLVICRTFNLFRNFETDTKINWKFSYKYLKKTEFLQIGPKIAVDELSMHPIMQMVIPSVIDYSASFLPIFTIWAYRHLVYSRATRKWKFTRWSEYLSRVPLKFLSFLVISRTFNISFEISKPIQKLIGNFHIKFSKKLSLCKRDRKSL